MNYSLIQLLNEYNIQIPIIQRDYAQGRENETELRNGFIENLYTAIQDNKTSINLDFVYGYTLPLNKNKDAFIPLDGQQRLTTLWLLHWYLAPRTEDFFIDEKVRNVLLKFSYQTRSSSSRFCASIINEPINIGQKSIKNFILDQSWFMVSWQNDPTVKNILNTIETIQSVIQYSNLYWEKLVKEKAITFDFIDIKSNEFKLTDELYIKMNSRGKPLTIFENFKSQFSTALSNKSNEYRNNTLIFEKESVNYSQYFSFKIDTTWIDLFWAYRDKLNNKVDEGFLNYIIYVAQLFYFKNNPSSKVEDFKSDNKPNFNEINAVFSKQDSVDFLFKSLDFFCEVNSTPFFDSIFKQVTNFENYTDYFLLALDKKFEIKDKIMLYAIVQYCLKFNLKNENKDLIDFVRIVRNFLLSIRQPNATKRIEYMNNLRINFTANYCAFIDSFINACYYEKNNNTYNALAKFSFEEKEFQVFIEHEIAKANTIASNSLSKEFIQRLEDHNELKGNLTTLAFNSIDLETSCKSFIEIWDNKTPNSLIIRAMLCFGDYSILTHEYSTLGPIYYFGKQNSWNRILTARNQKDYVSNSLQNLLLEYNKTSGDTSTEKLQKIIEKHTPIKKDWKYYFIKHASFTDGSITDNNGTKKELNIYSWGNDDNGIEINNLGNSGNQPLHSYHVDPFVFAVKQNFLENENIRFLDGRFGDVSFLIINDLFYVKNLLNCWRLRPKEEFAFESNIVSKYSLEIKENVYYLPCPESIDKIELIISFIKELVE